MCRSAFSWTRHWLEVNSQLHAPSLYSQGKRSDTHCSGGRVGLTASLALLVLLVLEHRPLSRPALSQSLHWLWTPSCLHSTLCTAAPSGSVEKRYIHAARRQFSVPCVIPCGQCSTGQIVFKCPHSLPILIPSVHHTHLLSVAGKLANYWATYQVMNISNVSLWRLELGGS
jgi:hypothetical protein